MKMDLTVTGLDNVLDLLQSLPAEVVSKNGGPVRTAMREGAKIIHFQAYRNLEAAINIHSGSSEYESTGLLLKSLVIQRGKMNGVKGEKQLVRVKRNIYPNVTGKPVSTLKTGALMEYGAPAIGRPAIPWLRPAAAMYNQVAVDKITQTLVKKLDKIVKDLYGKDKGPRK